MRQASIPSVFHGLAPYGVTLLLVGSVACAQAESIHPGPAGGGATGGSSGAGGSGASGGSGGSQGPAGSGGGAGTAPVDPPDSGPARFRATLQGETVRVRASDPVWMLTCEANPVLVQQMKAGWVPLVDDRPEGLNLLHAAHYLDGEYQSDCQYTNGCDNQFCEAFPEDDLDLAAYHDPLIAREYVQIGQSGALICGADDAGITLDAGIDAGLRLVPNIESRLPSAPLGVRVRYYRDSNCWTEAITTDVVVE